MQERTGSRVLHRLARRVGRRFSRMQAGVLLLALALIMPAALAQVARPSGKVVAAPAGFAYRCGIHFCKDGRLFYFAGANTYDIFTFGGSYGDTETTYMDKARIDAHFANLQKDGVTVLRLWMFSHETWHGFEVEKGIYNDQQFALFDYAIESAKAHNVYLMPVFENYWEAYGGIDTRLKWEGVTGGHPGRWRFFNKSICPGCFTSYKNYVSYALNRVNHYSGVAYKDEPIIFAWDLMNEPRYQDATPNENSTGTTLRAWVDEMAGYVKGIDPNHMVGVGLEAHEARFGFGGDEGNPFVYIQQSPYIDMTSAHPYPDESWANLTIPQTVALVRQWITESHEVVGKPFYLGEFNTHLGVRSDWWTAIFGEMERSGGDGSGFWWYSDKTFDSKFGVWAGQPELAVFRQHSATMAAKNVPVGPTPTPCTSCPTATRTATRTATPTRSPTATINPNAMLKVQYRPGEAAASTSQVKPLTSIVNISSVAVPLAELKLRYWYTVDGEKPQTYFCDYAPMGCGNVSGSFVKLAAPVTGADYYLELGFSSGAGTLAAGAQTGEIQNRFAKSDWSIVTQTNDYSFDGARSALSDWNNITLYRAGALVWGVEPGGSTPPTAVRTSTATSMPPSATRTSTTPPATTAVPTATRTFTVGTGATATRTTTRTFTVGTSATATHTATRTFTVGTGATATRTATRTFTSVAITPTPSHVVITPAPTFTPSPTRVASPTPTSGPTTGLRVQYKAAETMASTNQIKPHLNIVNGGTTTIALSELKARYYYSKEGTAGEQYFCDYAVKGCGNITGSFAAGYLEVGFTSGAGSLAAGQSSGEIQSRVAKTDWSNYTQTGDYSFDATKTAFADWTRVTLYRTGALVWGTPAP